jgi:hypothetical protein
MVLASSSSPSMASSTGSRRTGEGGRVHALEEIVDADASGAVGAVGDERRVRGEHRAGKIRRGIRVRDVSADRPTIANLNVADLVGRLGDDRRLLLHRLGPGDVGVRRERADRHRLAVALDSAHGVDVTDVDEVVRVRQSGLHRREEAVPAREDLRAGILREEFQRVVDALRTVVVELAREHHSSPPSVAVVPGVVRNAASPCRDTST